MVRIYNGNLQRSINQGSVKKGSKEKTKPDPNKQGTIQRTINQGSIKKGRIGKTKPNPNKKALYREQ